MEQNPHKNTNTLVAKACVIFTKTKSFLQRHTHHNSFQNTPKKADSTSFLPSFITIKFFYIVIINSIFYSFVRFLNIWEFLSSFAKSFLFDFCLLFAMCACIQKLAWQISQNFAQKSLNIFLNVLFVLSFVVGVVNLFLLLNFNSTLNLASFEIFLSTNLREAGEFSLFYANAKNFIVIVGFALLSVICMRIKNVLDFPKSLRIFVLLASAVFVCVGIIKTYQGRGFGFLDTQLANKTEIYHFAKVIYKGLYDEGEIIAEFRALDKKLDMMLASKANIKAESHFKSNTTFAKNSSTNSVGQIMGGGGEIESNKNHHKTNKDLPNPYASYISQSQKIPKIVLIIGESTQRNYMNLYGYPLENTPNLNALAKSQNLFVFGDVISPAADTATVLKKVLSFSNYENSHERKWYQNMNLIDAMKLLGYHTYWLSNQEAVSMHNSFDILAKRADTLRYGRLMESSPRALQDEILLKIYDDLAKSKIDSKEKFIIFHLQGTHYIYKWRYSDEFGFFSAQDLRDKGLDRFYAGEKKGGQISESQAKIRAHYLNAIAYNDFVVSEIIKRFRDEEAIIFYLSDHGDEVYDRRDFSGHGPSEFSRFVLEIPFMIYMSDRFKSSYPHIVERVKKAQNLAFMSDDFMHAMFDLLDIFCADSKKEASPFSKEYNAKRARIIHIGDKAIDYDKEIKDSKK